MAGDVVPFGKYKGQPVETLAADRDYCEWLTAQPWFSDKYRNVYNIVVNYGSEPQDSPEHNQMQVRFLEDDWCLTLADLVRPKRAGTYGVDTALAFAEADPLYQMFRKCCTVESWPARTYDRNFEDHGWDVVYGIAPAYVIVDRKSLVPPLPACTCQCDHTDCPEQALCRGGKGYCRHRHSRCAGKRGIDQADHCTADCYWASGELTYKEREWLKQPEHVYGRNYNGLIRVELKPDLGDDYPSVLRQVKGYQSEYSDDKRCVVVRRYSFQQVSWENVQSIFAASGVVLLSESSLARGTLSA